MATNKETHGEDEQGMEDEGLLCEVSDADLSKLAPRLGKSWRAFMRGELRINQWNIDEIESEPNLPVSERIYRLLRLWKSKSEEKPTVSCLICHLKNFEYSIETWEVLIKGRARSLSSDTDVSVFGSTKRPLESPYYKARGGINKGFTPQFCYVIQVTEDLNLHSFQGALHYPKGTKLDVVDTTRTTSLLSRDIGGNIIHIPREKCRQLQLHTPILWDNCWFHEEVTRTQLEGIFSFYEKGSFLIRESSENGFFAISVKDTSDIKNFKIKCTETGYLISDNRHFYNLTDLINFYKGTWIFTTEEGRLFLRDYVPKHKLPT